MKTLILLFCFIFFKSHMLYAKDIILVISFEDEWSFTSVGTQREIEYLQTHFPDSQVVLLSTKTKRFNFFNSRQAWETGRSSITQQFEKLNLRAEDKISRIILRTHGNSDYNVTLIDYVGIIEGGVADESIVEFFRPIRPYLSQNMRLVLDSCNAFCDTDSRSAIQAQALIEVLNTPNASIYGSSTFHKEIKTTQSKGSFMFSLMMGTIGGLINVGIQDNSNFHIIGVLNDFAPSFFSIIFINFILNKTLTKQIDKRLVKNGRVNAGRIFEFRTGEINNIYKVSYEIDHDKIMGLCQQSLLR